MYQLISYTKLDSTSTFKNLVAGSHDLAAGLNNSCFSFLLSIIISYILNCGKVMYYCVVSPYNPTARSTLGKKWKHYYNNYLHKLSLLIENFGGVALL